MFVVILAVIGGIVLGILFLLGVLVSWQDSQAKKSIQKVASSDCLLEKLKWIDRSGRCFYPNGHVNGNFVIVTPIRTAQSVWRSWEVDDITELGVEISKFFSVDFRGSVGKAIDRKWLSREDIEEILNQSVEVWLRDVSKKST